MQLIYTNDASGVIPATLNGDLSPDYSPGYTLRLSTQRTVTEKRVRPLPDDLFRMGTPRYIRYDYRTDQSVTHFWKQNGVEYFYSGPTRNFGGPAEGPSVIPPVDMDRLKMGLALKIGDSKANFGASLAEAKDLPAALTRAATFARHGYLALRGKLGLPELKRFLGATKDRYKTYESRDSMTLWNNYSMRKDAAGAYLSYIYGVVPAIQDCKAAAEYADSLMEKGVTYIESKGSTSRHSRSFKTQPGIEPGIKAHHHESGTEKARVTAQYTVSSPEAARSQQFGIGNVPLIAWEIFPFSHVVDWIIPVGNFLESLNSLSGIASDQLFVREDHLHSWYHTYDVYGGTSRNHGFSKFRGAISRGLPYSFPGRFQPRLGINQALQSVAMLTAILTQDRTFRFLHSSQRA